VFFPLLGGKIMAHAKTKLPAIGKCFDNLGGSLAPLLFERLIGMDWIRPKEGKKTVFESIEKGKKGFEEAFYIDISNLEK